MGRAGEEEEGEAAAQVRRQRHLWGCDGLMTEEEGAELVGRRKREEEEEEADGGGGEEEVAELPWSEGAEGVGHPEFLAGKEAEAGELRRGLGMEEGVEGLRGPLSTGEEGEVELSCAGWEEEEEAGGRRVTEVEEALWEGDE